MQPIQFYFDFLSPFAYLAHQRLPAIARRHGRKLEYHIADIAELKRLAGNTGPSNRDQPLKRRYLQADKDRWASRYGVPIVNPISFDARRINCAFFYAEERQQTEVYVTRAWHHVWGTGCDMASVALFEAVAMELGWNTRHALDFVESPEAAERYREASRNAHDLGVFGVPTMLIGKEMWWGNDRLDFLEEYLKQHV